VYGNNVFAPAAEGTPGEEEPDVMPTIERILSLAFTYCYQYFGGEGLVVALPWIRPIDTMAETNVIYGHNRHVPSNAT